MKNREGKMMTELKPCCQRQKLQAENERLKGAIQEWVDDKCISQKHLHGKNIHTRCAVGNKG